MHNQLTELVKYIRQLIQYLKQPYWHEYYPMRTTLVVTFLVVFVLAAFQPFGISRTEGEAFYIELAISALGSFLGMLIVFYPLPALFKKFYLPENWTIGKDIFQNLLTVFIVGISNGLVHIVILWAFYDVPLVNFLGIFKFMFIVTLIVSPIPVVVLTIWNRNRVLALNLRQAQDFNTRLMTRKGSDRADNAESIVLSGMTKESIELPVNELVYLEAYGNYVKVNYLQEDQMKQKVLRTTIKQMEETLEEYPFIIRCHRAFLVNTNHILNVKGNSQGNRLTFPNTSDEIPVSRAYVKTLKEQIESPAIHS